MAAPFKSIVHAVGLGSLMTPWLWLVNGHDWVEALITGSIIGIGEASAVLLAPRWRRRRTALR